MRKIYSLLASFFLLIPAGPAFAHEGHGNPQWVRSVLHYLIETEHLPVILPAVFVVLFFAGWVRRRVLQSRASLPGSQ